MTKTTKLYTVNETAAQLRICRDGVYQLINTGQLKSLKIGNRRLIAPRDVDAFIANAVEETSR